VDVKLWDLVESWVRGSWSSAAIRHRRVGKTSTQDPMSENTSEVIAENVLYLYLPLIPNLVLIVGNDFYLNQ
jgi:hypothetical protein